MSFRILPFQAVDGVLLHGHLFEAHGTARGGVLVLGALGVPQRYYARFASWLARRGFTVLTFDYRGVGASRPSTLRGDPSRALDWGMRDAPAALQALADHVEEVPLLGVGHSFGGQTLGLSDDLHHLVGMVTVGTQFGYTGHWSGLGRVGFDLVARALIPGLSAAFGYLPGWSGIGEDLPAGVATEWARWCASPGYLLDHVPDAAARYRRYPGELMVVSASDDAYAPEAAVQAYVDAFELATVHRWSLRPAAVGVPRIGHFGVFRPELSTTVWHELAAVLEGWVDGARLPAARARPLPYGASSAMT